MTKEVTELQKIIDNHDNIVFFGGAGVSTESGIPDFRSKDGLYNQKYKYPPETILSNMFFYKRPEEFFRFYRDKMICDTAKPNAAHLKLAKLEHAGKVNPPRLIRFREYRRGFQTPHELSFMPATLGRSGYLTTDTAQTQ